MKNAMQLKAHIKNIAKEKNISAQLVLQNYMLERYLERVSLSEYRDKYIIKGGFLISSLVGLESRATMDLDATIKGYSVNEDSIRSMVDSIISIPLDDGISFKIKSIGLIREDDIYILTKLQDKNIEIDTLRDALIATAEKRGSNELLKKYEEILKDLSKNRDMKHRWNNYRKDFSYASEIEFEDACESVIIILNRIAPIQ